MQYAYKGSGALRECRRVLTKANLSRIDAITGETYTIDDAGFGAEALLIAKTHPEMQVIARISDEEQYLTATRCEVPENLHYEQK